MRRLLDGVGLGGLQVCLGLGDNQVRPGLDEPGKDGLGVLQVRLGLSEAGQDGVGLLPAPPLLLHRLPPPAMYLLLGSWSRWFLLVVRAGQSWAWVVQRLLDGVGLGVLQVRLSLGVDQVRPGLGEVGQDGVTLLPAQPLLLHRLPQPSAYLLLGSWTRGVLSVVGAGLIWAWDVRRLLDGVDLLDLQVRLGLGVDQVRTGLGEAVQDDVGLLPVQPLLLHRPPQPGVHFLFVCWSRGSSRWWEHA